MLYLYYTGAKTFLSAQNESNKSIGGYISNTLIPKDILNNLFSDITNFALSKNKIETKCIAIKNNSNIDITNISVSVDILNTNICDYEFAFVEPTMDNCNNLSFELLSNSEQIPYYANFIDLSVSQTINLLPANKYIGLFIKRKIKSDKIDNPCLSTEQLENQLKEEHLELTFNW